MQATKDSRDNSPVAREEGDVISPEQLRFTAAVSKAMSKELAPLLAGRDLSQARPNVYQGSMKALLTAGAWSCSVIYNARKPRRLQMTRLGSSSVTDKAESERLRKYSNCWPVDSALEVIGCKCVRHLPLENSQKRKTGCCT